MGIIRTILDLLKIGDNDNTTANDPLTNKRLLAELVAHFKCMLEDESVGQRMLYPMSFNILMDPIDYENRKQSLPFVLPQVVASFYAIIEDKRNEYPDYTPPAKYWFFQFTSCQVGKIQLDDSTPLIVRRGHITTVATLLTFDIKEANNVSVDNNTRVSIKLDDSNVMNNINVNWNAIKSLDVLSEGTFIYNFDNTLDQNTQHITSNSNIAETNGLADLSYTNNGQTIHFTMKDDLIHISGKNELRNGRSIFKIDSPNIIDSHVQIRYNKTEQKFQIAAYGPIRLNSRKIEVSQGRDVKWFDLANNSNIFINDEKVVHFEIKQN